MTDLDVPGRSNSMQSDADMNRTGRTTQIGRGIRNEDDIDLGIDAEMDEEISNNKDA